MSTRKRRSFPARDTTLPFIGSISIQRALDRKLDTLELKREHHQKMLTQEMFLVRNEFLKQRVSMQKAAHLNDDMRGHALRKHTEETQRMLPTTNFEKGKFNFERKYEDKMLKKFYQLDLNKDKEPSMKPMSRCSSKTTLNSARSKVSTKIKRTGSEESKRHVAHYKRRKFNVMKTKDFNMDKFSLQRKMSFHRHCNKLKINKANYYLNSVNYKLYYSMLVKQKHVTCKYGLSGLSMVRDMSTQRGLSMVRDMSTQTKGIIYGMGHVNTDRVDYPWYGICQHRQRGLSMVRDMSTQTEGIIHGTGHVNTD
ncbi:hypothetical protein CHS0354_004932 [Potamilus streckersoni]|uniref:Uncharacterized protein n=1 Tax=Potamilus streckersoni TaxID=2493646 RepID=A0AAE0TJT2_9BIVA|nr:hypothetical protein CHS0354_004932 [Potamilus streckersoni]